MAVELVTYAELNSLLGLTGATIASYPALEVLQESVVSAFESYLGREFEHKERVEKVRVHFSTCMIPLKGLPVDTISSVTVKQSGITTTLVEDTDFEIAGWGIETFELYEKAMFTITYTGGFEVEEVLGVEVEIIPDNFKRAALLQTTYEYQNKDHIGALSVSTDGGMVSTPPLQLLSVVKEILNSEYHPLRW